MDRPYFALLLDPFATDQRITIFQDHREAELALDSTAEADAELQRFQADGGLLRKVKNGGPIYLAITVEDNGLRIRGAYNDLPPLIDHLCAHAAEAACKVVQAWGAPHWHAPEESLFQAMRA